MAFVTVTGRGRGGDSVSFIQTPGYWLGCRCCEGHWHWGCSHCHTATASPALSALGENAAVVALLCVEGKLLLANCHFVSSCDFPCPLPPPGLGSAQISTRKGYFPKERSSCPSKPGGADRLGECSLKAQVRIVASLKQQSREGRNSRGQGRVLPQQIEAWTAEETGPGSFGRAGLRPNSGQCLGLGVREGSPWGSLGYFHARRGVFFGLVSSSQGGVGGVRKWSLCSREELWGKGKEYRKP